MTPDTAVTLFCAGLFAVVGHGMVMWYKMGKIETKLELLMRKFYEGKNGA